MPPRSRPVAEKLPEERLACQIMQATNRLYTRIYHKLEVLSPPHLPERGPAIIVCNHTSGLDPHLIQTCCRRLITWMMAREYYELRGINPLMRILGVIPVARNGRDMSAMRAAMRALEQGQILGIFPEGKIETTRELLPFQTGVALLAIKTGVAVFPAYLDGTQRGPDMLPGYLLRQEATIAFGPQVMLDRRGDDRDSLTAATEAMRRAIESLRDLTSKARARRGL